MGDDVAIRVESVSKRFHLGSQRDDTLRDVLTSSLRRLLGRGRRPNPVAPGGKLGVEDDAIWALKDVSFNVKRGEVLGIIGHNGAGKSTLLKILSRITEPTKGRVEIRGRVGSLLEVGTGFHPELSGRENVFLNGAILGMKRAEIAAKFDEIVAFAGVETFIDTPVKRYSSGMRVRLGFAVAAYLNPEILIVDEVLAVGDAEFQRRCLGKMEEVSKGGRTVLFVSHSMGAIRGLCGRVVWLERGGVRRVGAAAEVVSAYLQHVGGESQLAAADVTDDFVVERVRVSSGRDGAEDGVVRPGDDVLVEIGFHARRDIVRPGAWVGLYGPFGNPVAAASTLLDGQAPPLLRGSGTLTCRFVRPPLLPQPFTVKLGVRANDGAAVAMKTRDIGHFAVAATAAECGFQGVLAERMAVETACLSDTYEWGWPSLPVRRVQREESGRWGVADVLSCPGGVGASSSRASE